MAEVDEAGQAFDVLAAELADDGFSEGRMFGLRCLKYSGKAIVALHEDGVAVKLGAGTPAHGAATGMDGATTFDPAGGRPMKDWVWLPVSQSAQWDPVARQAAEKLRS
ncbi:hypothetical protein GCM10022225_06630 [Plantactinospora mayteni]|uniref:TfoX N-terminal domain-containing protein n=1 Tax=Plantactinospora mayteni TaxID=566021 RepID=A0ABQ4ER62_9ACTN|nr:hypothetical protein [Plantactinospora mayteni]GIG97152.1 hypothetical protein Pma05_37250 [Plantactinospora mayteni]